MRTYILDELIGVTTEKGSRTHLMVPETDTTLCGTRSRFTLDWEPGTALPLDEVCQKCRGFVDW